MKYLKTVGTFECKVVEPIGGWFQASEKTGSDYVKIPVEVTEGEHKGETAVAALYLTENALDYTTRRLAMVFKFDGNYPALAAGKVTFVDMPCQIETENETYDGKTRLKVKWLNPPGGSLPDVKPMDASKLSSLLKKIATKGKAVAKDELSKAPAAPAPKAPAAPEEGDDVPF